MSAAGAGGSIADLAGRDLGTHVASYAERDAILYALAVGAAADDLALVYERQLRVLPTFALTLGIWAVEAAGAAGVYDPTRTLHVGQRLTMREPLAPAGEAAMRARVDAVWDKGSAALVEIVVEAERFEAGYLIFVPGAGGFGGDRGPSAPAPPADRADPVHVAMATRADQAALYRLTGDRHPVHIDPAVAEASGFASPILHGLCTLGLAARGVAEAVGQQPWDLCELSARLAAPVFPGDALDVRVWPEGSGAAFEVAATGGVAVVKAGTARFARSALAE